MAALILLVAFAGLGLLYAIMPDQKSVRWIASIILAMSILAPFAYLKWLGLQMETWKRDHARTCRVGAPLARCVAFMGPGQRETKGAYTKLMWKSGAELFVEPGRNNSGADWGVQAKDGVIIALLNLDIEANRPIWTKLKPEGYYPSEPK